MNNYNWKNYKAITNIPGWSERFSVNQIDTAAQAYAYIPLVFRAIRLRCNSLSSVPIAILKGETEMEWPFATPLRSLVWRTEAALLLRGAAYWEKVDNPSGVIKNVKWRNPYDVQVQYKQTPDKHNLLTFSQDSAQAKWTNDLTAETYEMVYFHEFDPSQDLLPGVSAAQVALGDAQLIRYLSRFAAVFFESGAQPVVLLPFESIDDPEKIRVEAFFKRMATGIRNAWRVLALRGVVTPQIITPPLETMVIPELHDQARRSVAAAFEIPQTMLEDAANYATSKEHKQDYWQNTVRPRGWFLEDVINPQLLEAFDLKIEFRFDELDIFQEDEAERAGSLSSLIDAGVPLVMAMEILGYDLSDEQWALLNAKEENKRQRAEDLANNLVNSQPPNAPPPNGRAPEQENELRAWRRKALKAVKAGKAAAVPFDIHAVPLSLAGAISGALESASNAEAVNAIFDNVWLGYP
jgi:HK97 family phage portal protein